MSAAPSPDHSAPSVAAASGAVSWFAGLPLPGATRRERLIACFGALIAIGLTGWLCRLLAGDGASPSLVAPLLAAPMGASAVLLFAVPASPLAQPWPIIGGNTLSALVGVAVAHLVPVPMAAAGLAVAMAIAAMSLTRCLHPPGGAAALLAVLAGPQSWGAGLVFVLMPVGLNAVMLTGLGWLFHALLRHHYPHRTRATLPPAGPSVWSGFVREDIDAALADLHETFDIDRDDLDRLLRQVEVRALARLSHAANRADQTPPSSAPGNAA